MHRRFQLSNIIFTLLLCHCAVPMNFGSDQAASETQALSLCPGNTPLSQPKCSTLYGPLLTHVWDHANALNPSNPNGKPPQIIDASTVLGFGPGIPALDTAYKIATSGNFSIQFMSAGTDAEWLLFFEAFDDSKNKVNISNISLSRDGETNALTPMYASDAFSHSETTNSGSWDAGNVFGHVRSYYVKGGSAQAKYTLELAVGSQADVWLLMVRGDHAGDNATTYNGDQDCDGYGGSTSYVNISCTVIAGAASTSNDPDDHDACVVPAGQTTDASCSKKPDSPQPGTTGTEQSTEQSSANPTSNGSNSSADTKNDYVPQKPAGMGSGSANQSGNYLNLPELDTLNNDTCGPSKANQWRGAFWPGGQPYLPGSIYVSQICLQGTWWTYTLAPSKPASCGPAYSAACAR